MKKKVVALLFASILALSAVACTESKEPEKEVTAETKEDKKEEPTSLIGTWKSKENEGSYQEAVISESSIEINWVSDGGKTKSLYWSGTYSEPTEKTDNYTWTSENNKENTETALMASSDDTKEFTFKDGIISYEASALGTTTIMELSQISTETPEVEENTQQETAQTSEMPVIKGSQAYDIILELESTGIPKAEAKDNSDGFDFDSVTADKSYSITTNSSHEIAQATFMVLNNTNDGYLGFCATMPYDTAASEEARTWVEENWGKEATTEFGDAVYEMSIGNQGPVLTIKAKGYDEYLLSSLLRQNK